MILPFLVLEILCQIYWLGKNYLDSSIWNFSSQYNYFNIYFCQSFCPVHIQQIKICCPVWWNCTYWLKVTGVKLVYSLELSELGKSESIKARSYWIEISSETWLIEGIWFLKDHCSTLFLKSLWNWIFKFHLSNNYLTK